MTFTIEQLEALKEDTTPGLWEATKNDILRAGWRGRLLEECPWYAEDEWEEEIDYMAPDDEYVLSNPEPDYKPLTDNHADMELVASAPALLDQLIATETKLQKVLNSIEKLRDWYNECGEYMHNLYEESLNPRFEEDSASYAQSADHLTEILEGNG